MYVAISTLSNGRQMTQSLRGVFTGSNQETILSQISTVDGENVQLFEVSQNTPTQIELLQYDAVKSAATVTQAAPAAPADQSAPNNNITQEQPVTAGDDQEADVA